MRIAIIVLLAYPLSGFGQTTTGSITADSGSTFDLSTAAVTRPMVKGTSLPATCAIGDQFFKTDAVAGQNIYGCTSANIWTLQAGGGGSSNFSAITGGTNSIATMACGTGCSMVTSGSGTIAATTASALATNPSPCTNQVVTDIAADGTLTCNSISNAMITNSTIDLTTKVTGILPNGNTSAASSNTASSIVARDGSGNFAATTITANLTGTASNATGLTRDGCATVTFSATPTFDASTDSCFQITLTNNVTSCTISNATTGQILTFNIIEDATGGRTFGCANLNGLQSIDTGISVRNSQTFIYDGSAVQALGFMISTGSNVTNQVCIPGSTSGTMCIKAPATGGGTVTGFSGSGTLLALNGALGTPSSGTGTNITGIPNNNVLATNLVTGTSLTMTAPRTYGICTGTCTVTVPVPAAGYEFCVMNDDNVSTAITLSALGSGAMYENSARTAYGTAGTGTLVVSAAAANKICILGLDSTHYLTVAYQGSVTVN